MENIAQIHQIPVSTPVTLCLLFPDHLENRITDIGNFCPVDSGSFVISDHTIKKPRRKAPKIHKTIYPGDFRRLDLLGGYFDIIQGMN
jgi:hypothetical protein